jgi:hypothetical protein
MRPAMPLALSLVLTLSTVGLADEPVAPKATKVTHEVTLEISGMT